MKILLKPTFLFVLSILFILNTSGQTTPEAMNYQGVARNAIGNPLVSQNISIRASILTGSSTGPAVYEETHTITTNQFGLFAIEIGRGTPVLGTFSGINWSTVNQWLEIEMDPAGGSSYTQIGVNELLSVPYAKYAENPGPQGATGPTGTQGPIGLTGPTGSQGPQGLIGLTGATGTQGLTGSQGSQGPIGLTGATGATGTQGTIGLTGPQGATGAVGPQGSIGLTGPTGNNGSQGPIGLTGPPGSQGPMGLTGATGPQGVQGPIGLTGSQGATGTQGPAGSANINGTTNRVIKFTSATTGGNSIINDNGSVVDITRNSGAGNSTFRVQDGGSGNGIFISKSGSGNGIEISHGTSGAGIRVNTTGGSGGKSIDATKSTTGTVLSSVSSASNGIAGYFQTSSSSNSSNAVYAYTAGSGAALYATGTGSGGGIIASPVGSGTAVRGIAGGSGYSGIFTGGDFGIGSTAPQAQLQVDATNDHALRVRINGATKMWVNTNGGTAIGSFTIPPTNGLSVNGTLTKGGGSFLIDHPLDPANQYLSHSFVESPDMMNIYNGNIITDLNGEATIQLPDYFTTLNKDYRYQLTVIRSPSNAYVLEEVIGNQFKIKTASSNVKVSWMVTGIRQDNWANKNRIPNAVPKEGNAQGKYLHPEAFGLPSNMRIGANLEGK